MKRAEYEAKLKQLRQIRDVDWFVIEKKLKDLIEENDKVRKSLNKKEEDVRLQLDVTNAYINELHIQVMQALQYPFEDDPKGEQQ